MHAQEPVCHRRGRRRLPHAQLAVSHTLVTRTQARSLPTLPSTYCIGSYVKDQEAESTFCFVVWHYPRYDIWNVEEYPSYFVFCSCDRLVLVEYLVPLLNHKSWLRQYSPFFFTRTKQDGPHGIMVPHQQRERAAAFQEDVGVFTSFSFFLPRVGSAVPFSSCAVLRLFVTALTL